MLVTGALDLPETFGQASEHSRLRAEEDYEDDEEDDGDSSSRMRSAVTSTNARPLKNIRSSQNDSDSAFEFDM